MEIKLENFTIPAGQAETMNGIEAWGIVFAAGLTGIICTWASLFRKNDDKAWIQGQIAMAFLFFASVVTIYKVLNEN